MNFVPLQLYIRNEYDLQIIREYTRLRPVIGESAIVTSEDYTAAGTMKETFWLWMTTNAGGVPAVPGEIRRYGPFKPIPRRLPA
jgi:hypothetical protein